MHKCRCEDEDRGWSDVILMKGATGQGMNASGL